MLQGFSSATGRPSAAEPPCRKDWPSGGICAFRRRLQDPGVTQVMRLPVLFAFPGILLLCLSWETFLPREEPRLFPSRWASLCSVRGRFLSLWRVPFPCPCKPFLKTLDFFCHWGSLPVLAVSCALSLKPFSVTANPCATASALPSPRAPFLSLENPFVGHCEGFLFRHRGSFFCQCTPFFLVTASSFPYHRKFPSLPPRVLSPVTASSFPCHCELLSLSLRAQRSSLVFPQYSPRVKEEEIASQTQKRARNDRPKGEKRDCFGNKEDDLTVTLLIGHSEPRSGEESMRRDCFADETTSSQ